MLLLNVCLDDVVGRDVLEAGESAHGGGLQRDPEQNNSGVSIVLLCKYINYKLFKFVILPLN